MNWKLDPVLHQPIRTQIMIYLRGRERAGFNELKRDLSLSDGHMSTHMKKLIACGYVTLIKKFVQSKPRTEYALSETGKNALRDYTEELRKLI